MPVADLSDLHAAAPERALEMLGAAAQALEFNEYKATQHFLSLAGEIKTVKKQWHKYDCGTWRPTDRHLFRPLAQSVIHPTNRTERREQAVLNHAEGAKQVSPDSLRGYYFAEAGAVYVNCANGILRIEGQDVRLLPHAPDYSFTRQTTARFIPDAACPRFMALLAEALPDPLDRALLAMVCGSFLLPDARFEAALVCYGLAGTGKSTVFDAVAGSLGLPLVSRLTMRQLSDVKAYHLPMLQHAAVNLGTELDSLEVEDGGTFKALCSGEPIQVRPIYGEPFIMQSTAKLVFLSNDLPRFRHGTDGELRRMRFLRFEHKPTTPDTTLKGKLAMERDGIFSWMLAGLMEALAAGALPHGGEQSQAAHARFAVSNDPIASFVNDRCELEISAQEEKAHVAEAYTRFLLEHGLPAALESSFFKRLYERFPGVTTVRGTVGTQRKQMLAGIQLREDA